MTVNLMPVLPNQRHERFAQLLAKGEGVTEAYQLAGYKPSRPHASRLAAHGNVETRVAELLEFAAKKMVVTIASLARQLDEDRELAHSINQAGAAVSATVAKAKLFGWMSEKVQHSGPNGGPIQTEVSVLGRYSLDDLLQAERVLEMKVIEAEE